MERLQENPNLRFDVHFTLNRFPLYVMHRAINLLVEEGMFHVVFPSDVRFPPLPIQGGIE
jgi:hypothetical protein